MKRTIKIQCLRMNKYQLQAIQTVILSFVLLTQLKSQNPFIRDQYSADPSARVFGDRVYVYPSHDILASEGRGRVGWFCMEDYHVFSSANLTDWTDHGIIVTQNKIPWVKPDSYAMWAPDCIYRNGKYYFYFPATPKDSSYGRSFGIGVAVSDNPTGPFIPQPLPIKNVRGIDPNVFIDKDGQAYLYWSQGNIFGAKLKENMLELDADPVTLQELPSKGLKEGPYLFERKGIYYLTYPHVENKIERLEYATSDNPLGPFKFSGIIMDESLSGCWTNHQSVAEFKGQWYLFYHDRDYSPNFDKARSIRMDSLFFNSDGKIQKVIPTLRGVGLTDASQQIQIDRYSVKSNEGASIDFLDTLNRFGGWKAILNKSNGWIQYNSVNFSNSKFKSINVKALSTTGSVLEIRLNSTSGPVIAEVKIPSGTGWRTVKAPVKSLPKGRQNVVLVLKGDTPVEVDWINFE
jgi:GH43 family beta-xylosidase